MRTSDITVGRIYVRIKDGVRVTVTRVWDPAGAEDGHRGVDYDIHDDRPGQLGSTCPDFRFVEWFRPFDLPDDPMKLTVDLVKAFVEEIRRTAESGDDDAAAGMEERLHASVLRATAAGHQLARWVAKAALATENISFQRHTI